MGAQHRAPLAVRRGCELRAVGSDSVGVLGRLKAFSVSLSRRASVGGGTSEGRRKALQSKPTVPRAWSGAASCVMAPRPAATGAASAAAAKEGANHADAAKGAASGGRDQRLHAADVQPACRPLRHGAPPPVWCPFLRASMVQRRLARHRWHDDPKGRFLALCTSWSSTRRASLTQLRLRILTRTVARLLPHPSPPPWQAAVPQLREQACCDVVLYLVAAGFHVKDVFLRRPTSGGLRQSGFVSSAVA